jgi:hypothetical protein
MVSIPAELDNLFTFVSFDDDVSLLWEGLSKKVNDSLPATSFLLSRIERMSSAQPTAQARPWRAVPSVHCAAFVGGLPPWPDLRPGPRGEVPERIRIGPVPSSVPFRNDEGAPRRPLQRLSAPTACSERASSGARLSLTAHVARCLR